MVRGFKANADRKSIKLRNELELEEHDPLCAFDLAEHLKVIVKSPRELVNLDGECANTLLSDSSPHWSASVIPIHATNGYLIIHNSNHSPARQQSNIMHEIAHILCKHSFDRESEHQLISPLLRSYDKDQEDEANYLGACLQLPRPALLYSMKKQMTPLEISEHYNASIEMVRYRMQTTGVRRQIKYYKH